MPLPFNRQNEPPRPFKPFVAQIKTVPTAGSVKPPPVAPPVYKPQAKPVAAQLKKAGPTPPPVYRPQPSPKVLQTKKVGPQSVQNIRPTTTNNTIQRSLDPVAVVGGSLLVAAIGGLIYGVRKCAAGDREPEAPATPLVEKKEPPITREAVIAKAEALKVKAKGFPEIKEDIRGFLSKLDKFSSYEYADKRLTDIANKLSGRERSSMGSASPYAPSVEGPKVRRVKVKKQEEKKEFKVAKDINEHFNSAKACVLYALERLHKGAFGESDAHRLHDRFWSSAEYEHYQQYSDIKVIKALFNDRRSGMTVVGAIAPNTVTVQELPELLPPGRYAVITRSSVSVGDDDDDDSEEHMLLLENGIWKEFRSGYFQDARRDDNALVRGVWR